MAFQPEELWQNAENNPNIAAIIPERELLLDSNCIVNEDGESIVVFDGLKTLFGQIRDRKNQEFTDILALTSDDVILPARQTQILGSLNVLLAENLSSFGDSLNGQTTNIARRLVREYSGKQLFIGTRSQEDEIIRLKGIVETGLELWNKIVHLSDGHATASLDIAHILSTFFEAYNAINIQDAAGVFDTEGTWSPSRIIGYFKISVDNCIYLRKTFNQKPENLQGPNFRYLKDTLEEQSLLELYEIENALSGFIQIDTGNFNEGYERLMNYCYRKTRQYTDSSRLAKELFKDNSLQQASEEMNQRWLLIGQALFLQSRRTDLPEHLKAAFGPKNPTK